MVFLVVFGLLMLILSAFYLVNSWQQYREWLVPTLMVLASLGATIYGTVNLPYWHHEKVATHQTAKKATKSSSAASSTPKTAPINGTKAAFDTQTSGTQAQKEMYLLRQLQKAYSKMGTVSFDEGSKTYKIMPTEDKLVEGLNYISENPSQAGEVGWSNLTSSLDQTSKQIKKVLGDGYSLSMQKPGDDQNALYTVKDGQKVYDVAQ